MALAATTTIACGDSAGDSQENDQGAASGGGQNSDSNSSGGTGTGDGSTASGGASSSSGGASPASGGSDNSGGSPAVGTGGETGSTTCTPDASVPCAEAKPSHPQGTTQCGADGMSFPNADTDCQLSPASSSPPSCEGMSGTECAGGDCCKSIALGGDAFMMGRSINGADAFPRGLARELPEHSVNLSPFLLDKFEITVGRFRKFVAQFDGTPPSVGSSAHPTIDDSGWNATWNSELPSSQVALIKQVNCVSEKGTWTDGVGPNETKAINCISWYTAAAFCAWDNARLPTQAEWEYAAAGGSENLLYPWGDTAPSDNLANFQDDVGGVVDVGSYPAGNGSKGHSDLAGNVWEWMYDWYVADFHDKAPNTQTNPAQVSKPTNANAGPFRVRRGGNYESKASGMRGAFHYALTPIDEFPIIGARCARNP